MTWIDKPIILMLIIIDAAAIIIGMVSGPFGYDEISLSASMAACIISAAIIIFGVFTWKQKNK